MGHEVQDQVSLELARRIAAGLPEHPEWLALARANLARWMRQNAAAPTLQRCYTEWLGWLERSPREISAVLSAETDEGQRLRQNSPFAGVLPPDEVWEIKSHHRRHAARKLVKPDILARLKKTWGDRIFSAKEVAEMRAAELEG